MDSKVKSKLDQYLAEQARYKDSPLTKFLNIFELNLILKELNPTQREQFLELLEEEKFEEVLEFIGNNIPNFGKKLKKEINTEDEKIKNVKRNANNYG
jgi:Mg/Co/Ni transporter MgtE